MPMLATSSEDFSAIPTQFFFSGFSPIPYPTIIPSWAKFTMPQIYPYSPGSGGGDSESDLGDEKSAFLPIIHDSRKRPLRQRLVYIGYGTLLAISWLIAFSCIGLQYSDYKHACDFVRSWETGLSTEFGEKFSFIPVKDRTDHGYRTCMV